MNDSNSLERRYSFNLAQGVPIAESTHLNWSSFSWGSVSPKIRGSSNSPLTSHINKEGIAKPRNLLKIDARTAADVQSNGLASRIVKYQESGTRLNRSISAHNLYSKAGQFPNVTLKKTNLPYRAAKRELSMIRIPPPDKSSFYGNTVSSLLRSSSVIGLQSKQNEDLSTENRPIIHPPPSENDLAPTRSVLDVLKEISRKRINSDELESEESSKKYCSRVRNDFVDTAVNKNFAVQETCLTSLASPRQRYKRLRERQQQSVTFLDAKTSPEQAKKRICNYNNDITSSLSSSIKSKKMLTLQNLNKTMPTNFQQNEKQSSKGQHKSNHPKSDSKNADKRFRNIENNWKELETFSDINHSAQATVGHDQNNSAVASQKFASESFFNSKKDEKIDKGLTSAIHKPRLTLFNKKFDECESKEESKTFEFEEKNDDCSGIPFVKPKKIASNSGLRNPVIERTQKSKLALMLSGLRGELYQDSGLDELDYCCKRKIQNDSAISNTNTFTSLSKTSNNIPTLTTNTSTTTVTSTSNIETPTNVKTSLPLTHSPLVGLKLKSASENISSLSNVDTAKNSDLLSQSNISVLGGFSHCTTSSSSTPTVQPCPHILQIENKNTSVQTSTISVINNSTGTKPPPIALFTTNGKNDEISAKLQISLNTPSMQPAAVCTAETLPTNSANTMSTTSTLTIGKTFTCAPNFNNSNTNNSTLPSAAESSSITVVSSAPVVFGTSTTMPINAFNFSTPATSSSVSATSSSVSAPLVFGVAANSTNLSNTISTSAFGVKSNAVEHKTVVSSENPFGPIVTSVPNFSANNKSSASEIGKYSGNGILPIAFNIGANNNSINFKFDAKSQNSADQCREVENNGFNSNTSAQFNSQCLNTKSVECSISAFDNIPKGSDNNIFNSSGISIFGSKSLKPGTQVFESKSSNKSDVLAAPPGYGDDKINKNKSMPFSFVSSTTALAPTTSSNAGGFSFSSSVSKSKETGQTDTPNNSFYSVSPSGSQNSFIFGSSSDKLNSSNIFGVSTNKPENVPQGGFSFGGATPIKTSTTFTFGAEKTSKSDAIGANITSTGFPIGASVDAKQNVFSINKPFSFGSPQTLQQNQTRSSSIGNSLNIFGLTNASKAAQLPAFNFASGDLQPTNPTNIFAQTNLNVAAGAGDRPIRRATRRLQK